MDAPAFTLFGPAHLGALAVTGLVAAGLVRLARAGGRAPAAVRYGLSALLVGLTGAVLVHEALRRPLGPWDFVPLHLCDFTILVAVFALLAQSRRAAEILYFWAGSGTLLAMLTPDLQSGFPSFRFISFFGLHGSVLAAAAALAFGLGLPPRPGGALRAFLLLNLYAAGVFLVDLGFDQNFLFLREKPSAPTLLDRFGPWPSYIAVSEVIALASFALLALPFRRKTRRAGPPEISPHS